MTNLLLTFSAALLNQNVSSAAGDLQSDQEGQRSFTVVNDTCLTKNKGLLSWLAANERFREYAAHGSM